MKAFTWVSFALLIIICKYIIDHSTQIYNKSDNSTLVFNT